MNRLAALLLMCVALLLGCDQRYDASLGQPGPNGEPRDLKHVHSVQFNVAVGDYFTALNEFYSFAHAETFDNFRFGKCFNGILEKSADGQAGLPCIGTYAVKGSPVKAHMTFTVVAKSFNRRGGNDFLTCRIDIYSHDTYRYVAGIAPNFQSRVEGKLRQLDRKVAARTDAKQ
jgi:hypothetical protein